MGKKKKVKSEAVISKPIGLVTPLEKRRKRVNYLEMHTGKLSPVSMIKSDENKKSTKDETEADLSRSEVRKKSITSGKNATVSKVENKNKNETKEANNALEKTEIIPEISSHKSKQNTHKNVKAKKDKDTQNLNKKDEGCREKGDLGKQETKRKQGDMYTNIKSGRRGKNTETTDTLQKDILEASQIAGKSSDEAIQSDIKNNSGKEFEKVTKDSNKKHHSSSPIKESSENSKDNTKICTAKIPVKNTLTTSKRKSGKKISLEKGTKDSSYNSLYDDEALKPSTSTDSNSSKNNELNKQESKSDSELGKSSKKLIVTKKNVKEAKPLGGGHNSKGIKIYEGKKKKNAKIITKQSEKEVQSTEDDNLEQKTEKQTLPAKKTESKPKVDNDKKVSEEKLDIYKGESVELMKDTIRKTLRKLTKESASSLKALDKKNYSTTSKTVAASNFKEETKSTKSKVSNKADAKEKKPDINLLFEKAKKLTPEKEALKELIEDKSKTSDGVEDSKKLTASSKVEIKDSQMKNAKTRSTKRPEKTPTKITEVEHAEEIIEDMQRIQEAQKSECITPTKCDNFENSSKTFAKNKRRVNTSDNEQQPMDAEHEGIVAQVSSKASPTVNSNKTKKLINKYKQNQSNIVKRLGTVAVFSSRRKRNCRTENEDVLRKTQKKKKVVKPKMKIDTALERDNSQMETEDNDSTKMELDVGKDFEIKTLPSFQEVVPMNEETPVTKEIKLNLQNHKKINQKIIEKAVIKPKRNEKS